MNDDLPENEFAERPELIKKRARAEILQRVGIVIVAVFMAVTLVILSINALASIKSRDTLLDCTQPEGKCAQENVKQTGELIQSLIDSNSLGDLATQHVVVLAAACAEEPEIKAEDVQERRIALLEQCVNDQLKQEKEDSK